MTQPLTHLFSPLTLRGVTLPNRIVISPMQQYAAGPDGVPNEFHRQHYGRLSLGVENLTNKDYILSWAQIDFFRNYFSGRGRVYTITHTINF